MVETMLVIAEAGGFGIGGVNFDAKVRRNSTDLEDIFIAHIAGMDVFARSLLIAEKMLNESAYKKMRAERYASFDSGDGAKYEKGELKLADLREIAIKLGEPAQISGKQELYEQMINLYI
jgi:xylose isomerase